MILCKNRVIKVLQLLHPIFLQNILMNIFFFINSALLVLRGWLLDVSRDSKLKMEFLQRGLGGQIFC